MTCTVDLDGDEAPPTYTSLADVYDFKTAAQAAPRYEALYRAYVARFGSAPSLFVRSPGRVNLIGEHIDYAGFSVLPMALNRDILLAVGDIEPVGPGGTVTVRLHHADHAERYVDTEWSHQSGTVLEIDKTVHHWGNYVQGAYRTTLEQIQSDARIGQTLSRFNLAVSSTLPIAAGLSSSAALTCGASLATMAANGVVMKSRQLVRAAIDGEHLAGVACGGMDQSICMLGHREAALRVDFAPHLHVSPVPLPLTSAGEQPVFIIAQTLKTAEKHKYAAVQYNLRFYEATLGAVVLARALNISVPCKTYHAVLNAYYGPEAMRSAPAETLAEAMQRFEDIFPVKGVVNEADVPEMLDISDLSIASLRARYAPDMQCDASGGLHLFARGKHILAEAHRVYAFDALCKLNAGSSMPDPDGTLKALGQLMHESHRSCVELYDCSSPELDTLTTLAEKHGAFGSRLTGAGWGGSCVSLVTADRAAGLIASLCEEYYYQRRPEWRHDPAGQQQLSNMIFASAPQAGANIFRDLIL